MDQRHQLRRNQQLQHQRHLKQLPHRRHLNKHKGHPVCYRVGHNILGWRPTASATLVGEGIAKAADLAVLTDELIKTLCKNLCNKTSGFPGGVQVTVIVEDWLHKAVNLAKHNRDCGSSPNHDDTS